MPVLRQTTGPEMAFRLPWADKIPPLQWPAGKVVGFLAYEMPLFSEANRIGNVLGAVDAMVRIEEVLEGAAKSRIYAPDIEATANAAGVEDFDLSAYRGLRNAYIEAFIRGEIGEWDPNEVAYPRYRALRSAFYRAQPLRPNIQPVVQLQGYANEKRLVVGNVMAGHNPENQMVYRLQTAPAPVRSLVERPTSEEIWWNRKQLTRELPRLRKGIALEVF